jgi:hypothetical protein
MSKVTMMLTDRPVSRALRPPPNTPIKPPPTRAPLGPLFRFVRQGPRSGFWRPWWLLGLVEVSTYPYPRFRDSGGLYVPGVRASCGMPARPALMIAVPS